MSKPSKPKIEIWTLAQRKTLLGLCVAGLLFLLIEGYRKPARLSDPPGAAARAAEIQDRIDPNIADAAALSAIPNLGEVKASEIIEYRETFAKHHRGVAAFTSPQDLMAIKGIGPGTVSNIEPFLIFTEKAASH
jgi:DNA uptake protein ComE-like DNA-binding protein